MLASCAAGPELCSQALRSLAGPPHHGRSAWPAASCPGLLPTACCLLAAHPEQMLKPAAGAAALGVPAGVGADSDATGAVLATYAAQQPSLSIVKGWDALNLLAAPVRRRKGQASAPAVLA